MEVWLTCPKLLLRGREAEEEDAAPGHAHCQEARALLSSHQARGHRARDPCGLLEGPPGGGGGIPPVRLGGEQGGRPRKQNKKEAQAVAGVYRFLRTLEGDLLPTWRLPGSSPTKL